MTLEITTVGDVGVPRWMTPHARHLFRIPTHMTPQERLLLLQTALSLEMNFSVVEVGSYLGASTAFLALAALQRNGTIHAVDLWTNQAMGPDSDRDTWAEFRTNTAPFEHYIIAHRGESVEVSRRDGPIVCEMLFIDGDHSYEGAVRDLRAWLPSLKANGVLAMHDFDAPGVRRAFDELIAPTLAAPPQVADRLMFCRPQSPAVAQVS